MPVVPVLSYWWKEPPLVFLKRYLPFVAELPCWNYLPLLCWNGLWNLPCLCWSSWTSMVGLPCLCWSCWTSMMKLPAAIMLKRTLEFTMFMLVSITWFLRVVIAPSAMRFILIVRRAFSKGRFLLANIFKRFWWLLPRFFYLYHMRLRLFSKEVSFTFLLYILIFLKYGFCFSSIFHYHFQDVESTGIWYRTWGLT